MQKDSQIFQDHHESHFRFPNQEIDVFMFLLWLGFIVYASHLSPCTLLYRHVPPKAEPYLSMDLNLTRALFRSWLTSAITGFRWYIYHPEGSAITLIGIPKKWYSASWAEHVSPVLLYVKLNFPFIFTARRWSPPASQRLLFNVPSPWKVPFVSFAMCSMSVLAKPFLTSYQFPLLFSTSSNSLPRGATKGVIRPIITGSSSSSESFRHNCSM